MSPPHQSRKSTRKYEISEFELAPEMKPDAKNATASDGWNARTLETCTGIV